MPFDKVKRSKEAKIRPRDEHGHFIPKNTQIKSSTRVSGSGKIINDLLRGEQTEDDDALVNVRVSNPLKKITQLLQDIKNKQSTTVSMRFTIPLIALPIAFLLAFQLGRANSECINNFSSKVGTLKVVSINRDHFLLPYLPESLNFKETISEEKAVLIEKDGQIINLEAEDINNMKDYENLEVIATGDYSSCLNTLSINSPLNIQRAN